jgi:hypothetical protein
VAKLAKAVVVVDEFQAVRHKNMADAVGVEGSFAAASDPARTLGKTAWLFLGSDREAMHQIFTVSNDAFKLKTQHLPVGPIRKETIIPFLNDKSGFIVDEGVGDHAYKWTEGIPGDLQRLYSAMIGQSAGEMLGLKELSRAQAAVVDDMGQRFSSSLAAIEAKSPGQLDLMRIIAKEDIRSVRQLASAANDLGQTQKDLNKNLAGILEEGLLHYRASEGDILERPEPILFHFLASRGTHAYTAAGALANAFRKIPTPHGRARRDHSH